MKRFLTLVGMRSAAIALAFIPAISATAATGSAVTTGINGRSVAISMTPGTHTITETVPIHSQPELTAPRSAHTAFQGNRSGSGAISLTAAPQIQVRVGKNNCGGFNGNYSIYIAGYDTGPGGGSFPIWGLTVSGTEWDNCDYYNPEYHSLHLRKVHCP